MLFSQMDKSVWQEEIISLMKVGQLWGHSCLRMETRTRFSLFKNVRCALSACSDLEFSMMKVTTKFRIPIPVSHG
jgi:hypothetical protein